MRAQACMMVVRLRNVAPQNHQRGGWALSGLMGDGMESAPWDGSDGATITVQVLVRSVMA